MCKNCTTYIVRSLTNKVNSDCWDNLRIHQWKWDVSNWQYKYQLGVERISDIWQELPEFFRLPNLLSVLSVLSVPSVPVPVIPVLPASSVSVQVPSEPVRVLSESISRCSGQVRSIDIVRSQWILWDPRRFCEIRLAHRLCWVFF